MIELSVIRDLVACFGVIAGFSYYVLTIRATRKNQQQQLETRRIQLFTQLTDRFVNVNAIQDYADMLHWSWDDYADFERQYGSEANPKGYATRACLWISFNMIGKLESDGAIDTDLVYTIMHDTIVWQWMKWKDIIGEQRTIYYTSDYMMYWEQLAEKLLKIKMESFPEWSVPEGLGTYPQDQ